MKRDMDLVRKILLAMEASPSGFAPAALPIDGYDEDAIGHHMYLMKEGELVTAVVTTAYGRKSPVAVPLTITWKGHEFLAVTRNEKVWSKLKTELKERGLSLPFSLMQDLAIKIAASLAGL